MRYINELLVRLLPGIWLGLIMAISLIETPLKFTAPQITLERGLGIGRIVFHALNNVELAIGAILLLALFVGGAQVGKLVRWTIVLACVALVIQVAFVRPVLDRRLDDRVAGKELKPSAHHIIYIGLEGAKILALAAAGISIAAAGARTARS